jgi:hypothetical protein
VIFGDAGTRQRATAHDLGARIGRLGFEQGLLLLLRDDPRANPGYRRFGGALGWRNTST